METFPCCESLLVKLLLWQPAPTGTSKQQHLQNFARISPRISTRLQIVQMVLTCTIVHCISFPSAMDRIILRIWHKLPAAWNFATAQWWHGARHDPRAPSLLVDWLVPRTVNFLESPLPTWYQTVHYRPCSHARHQEICVTTAAASTCARSWYVFPMWEDEWIGVIILPEKGSNDSTIQGCHVYICLYNLMQHFRIAIYKIIEVYNTRQLRQKVRI